jgi:hypothetical protein
MKRRKTDKLINPTNILLSILITILTTFFSYIITDIKDLKTDFKDLRKCVQERLEKTATIVANHIEWHKGRGDVK